jgi:hypothetical protein
LYNLCLVFITIKNGGNTSALSKDITFTAEKASEITGASDRVFTGISSHLCDLRLFTQDMHLKVDSPVAV